MSGTFTSGRIKKSGGDVVLQGGPPEVDRPKGPPGQAAYLYPAILKSANGQYRVVENKVTPSTSDSPDVLSLLGSAELFGTDFAADKAMAHSLKYTSPGAYKFAVAFNNQQ